MLNGKLCRKRVLFDNALSEWKMSRTVCKGLINLTESIVTTFFCVYRQIFGASGPNLISTDSYPFPNYTRLVDYLINMFVSICMHNCTR